MKRTTLLFLLLFTVLKGWAPPGAAAELPLELRGTAVIPHVQSTEMRYRREPDRSLGARVQLFLVNEGSAAIRINPESSVHLRGKSPQALLAVDEWAWHDFPSTWTDAPLELPPGALTVWSFNGKRAPWGAGTTADVAIDGRTDRFAIATPTAWLSAVTFLGDATNPFPNSLIFHIANRTAAAREFGGRTQSSPTIVGRVRGRVRFRSGPQCGGLGKTAAMG